MADFLLSVIVMSTLLVSVVSKCTFQTFPIYPISEEAPENTTILSFTKEAGDTVSLSVQNPDVTAAVKALKGSLRFVEENTTVHLRATKKLDLEVFWDDYKADITTIRVKITCSGVQSSSTEITILVQPVNEFPPVFLQGPYNLLLPESTSLMTTVFSLKDKVYDGDHGEQPNFLDGRPFFNIPTNTKGDIVVSTVLDYDDSAISHVMTLNLSVTDSGGLRSFTTLELKILDVDDQPPYFDYPNCTKPCSVPLFIAITELDYKGPLQTSVPIKVYDNDTLGTKLQYLFFSGNDKGLFTIDINSGIITQIRTVNEVQSQEAELRLVIKVRKNISIVLESLAILTVKVRERMPNYTGYLPNPAKSTETPGTSSGFLISTLVLATLCGCSIAALTGLTIVYWKRRLVKHDSPDYVNQNFEYGSVVLPSPSGNDEHVYNSVVN